MGKVVRGSSRKGGEKMKKGNVGRSEYYLEGVDGSSNWLRSKNDSFSSIHMV